MKNKIQSKTAHIQDGPENIKEINNGLILNLLVSKGASTKGKAKFVPDMKVFLQEPNRDDVVGNILICNFLEHSHYAILSALNASAVICFSMNYTDYLQVMVVNSSLGVFGGFGNLSFNTQVTEYLQSLKENEIYFDTLYNRVIIPDSKLPESLANYEFDLQDIFGYK